MDFGSHTPYIVVAYGASIVALAGLIAMRLRRFKAAQRGESENREAGD